MRLLIICLLLIALGACKAKITEKPKSFNNVEIVHLVEDSTLNIRALEILDSLGPIYLTSKGELGMLFQNKVLQSVDSLDTNLVPYYKLNLTTDSLQLNFRALAVNEKNGFGITVGNPALLYKLNADLEKNKIVYQENHPNVFYDAMDFWNEQEGIAIGDPTDGCMSIIITRDGGENWTKMSCNNLPSIKDGEAAFAASDTNIAIVGDETWVATGGKTSRVMYSPDKGITWRVFDTPIIQGKETTGIYSIDFYDENNGFAIGGDYTNPEANSANKIRTTTGGVTWQVVSDNEGPGYRSCVQYIPNSDGNELVAVGFNGIDYSADFGNTWKHLSDEGFYTIRFLNDSTAYAAGKGRVSKLIFTK